MSSVTENWQDYRGKGEGVLIHLSTTRRHELPVRDSVETRPVLEPNYEAGTFGFIQCIEARARMAALKARRRHFLFGTRYQGLIEPLRGRFLIIGTMRLDRTLDVRKKHSHQWMEKNSSEPPDCLDMESCPAFQSGEMNFYAPADAFELSEELMQKWGYKGKITQQMKLTFTEDKLSRILDHFKEKTPCNADYQEALKTVSPVTPA